MKHRALILLITFFMAGIVQAQSTPSVDLIWSADTYTPPLYSGHTMVTPQSRVKLVTLTNDWGTGTENLNYTWQRNGQALLKSSGPGQNVFSFTAGNAGEIEKLTVSVSTPDQKTRREQTISIPVVNPSISIYQNESLTGVNYNQAVGSNINLGQPEINLLAEPYFFTKTDVANKKIDYRWQLNDQKVVPDSSDNRLITFAVPSGTSGENIVTLTAESLSTIFQTAKKQFKITFGGATNFNF